MAHQGLPALNAREPLPRCAPGILTPAVADAREELRSRRKVGLVLKRTESRKEHVYVAKARRDGEIPREARAIPRQGTADTSRAPAADAWRSYRRSKRGARGRDNQGRRIVQETTGSKRAVLERVLFYPIADRSNPLAPATLCPAHVPGLRGRRLPVTERKLVGDETSEGFHHGQRRVRRLIVREDLPRTAFPTSRHPRRGPARRRSFGGPDRGRPVAVKRLPSRTRRRRTSGRGGSP